MKLSDWNENKKIQENKEVVCKAEKDDILFKYKGYYFLCQRYNDINNLVWVNVKDSKVTIIEAFKAFKKKLTKNNVQYCQVTTDKRLRFLAYIHIFQDLNLDYVYQVSDESPRFEIILKLY